jgi:hypothetical protein
MNEIASEFIELAAWLHKQARQHPFGDHGVLVSCHNGKISRIDYTSVVKYKPKEGKCSNE